MLVCYNLPMGKTNKKTKRAIYNIIGWLGAALIVGAYLLNSFGVLDAQGLLYQLINLLGAICILTFSVVWKAYPNVVTNAIWSVGAIVAIVLIVVK